jgi:pimeloyl-ACP methyl ester carboxylesterase
MTTPPAAQTFFLKADDPVCVSFHPAAQGIARHTAVILCPPFGFDEVCSYRPRREWARALSVAGYPALRVSFPSTGDSGGFVRDPRRLEAWTAAIADAASWLRGRPGSRRIVAVGMGLGGIVAYRAVATGAAVDDLVLWSVPARARALIRQLRAFSKLEVSRFFEGLEPPPPLPEGELEAGGFLLSAETVRELEQLDLTSMELPAARSRRVLALERDGIPVDAELLEALQASGVELQVSLGEGYGAMTSHPQRAEVPTDVIGRVTAWLDEKSQAATDPSQAVSSTDGSAGTGATASSSVLIRSGGEAEVRETPITIQQPFGSLAGIVSEPANGTRAGVCAVFLNAGAVRRIGPSRIWVEAARRWAARGVRTVRLDVEGIGDADGDATPYVEDGSLYVQALVPQVLSALDDLQQRDLGDRFMLAGLCAGAYWAFHAALQDQRVVAALMLNAGALIWDDDLAPARDFRALLGSKRSWSRIRRNATPERVRALSVWMLGGPKRKLTQRSEANSEQAPVDEALERLRGADARAMFLFSAGEPVEEELIESGWMEEMKHWPNVTFEHVPVRDHTMRPNWAQGLVHEALDRALERELAEPRATPSSSLIG